MSRQDCSDANAKDAAKLLDGNEAVKAHDKLLECVNGIFTSQSTMEKYVLTVKQFEKKGVGIDLEIDFHPRDGDLRNFRFK